MWKTTGSGVSVWLFKLAVICVCCTSKSYKYCFFLVTFTNKYTESCLADPGAFVMREQNVAVRCNKWHVLPCILTSSHLSVIAVWTQFKQLIKRKVCSLLAMGQHGQINSFSRRCFRFKLATASGLVLFFQCLTHWILCLEAVSS